MEKAKRLQRLWLPSNLPKPATSIVDDFDIAVDTLIKTQGNNRRWDTYMLNFVLTEEDKLLWKKFTLRKQWRKIEWFGM